MTERHHVPVPAQLEQWVTGTTRRIEQANATVQPWAVATAARLLANVDLEAALDYCRQNSAELLEALDASSYQLRQLAERQLLGWSILRHAVRSVNDSQLQARA
jgi:hypothetical protein